jgi:C_GCAxxG_C_C family probable redox protein
MLDRVERAVADFGAGFNCCQAVLSSYADLFGIDLTTSYRIACGFGGGMGRLQEVCGAVTGAMMIAGLKDGKTRSDDADSLERTYASVRLIAERFKEEHGTIICRELLQCDISTADGRRHAKANNLFSTICAGCVRDSANLVEEVVLKD